jgi:hypothetical protein
MAKRAGAPGRRESAPIGLPTGWVAPSRASGSGAATGAAVGVAASGAVRSQSHIERFRGRRLIPSHVGAPFGPRMLAQPLKISASIAAVTIGFMNPRLILFFSVMLAGEPQLACASRQPGDSGDPTAARLVARRAAAATPMLPRAAATEAFATEPT